jgi:hypothetical protein
LRVGVLDAATSGTRLARRPGVSRRSVLLRRLPIALAWLSAAATSLAVAQAAAVRAGSQPPPLTWTRSHGGGHGTPWLAVAAGPRVVVGDADGVAVLEPGGGLRRIARLPDVRDLAFDHAGRLWIATARGLHSLDRLEGASLRDRGPGTGETARVVRRVAWRDGVGVAATARGVFASTDGERWRRLPDLLSSLSAELVALSGGPGSGSGCGADAWIASERELFHARLECDAGSPAGLAAVTRRLPAPPGRPVGELPVDLVTDWAEAELVVLYPRHLALLREVAPATAVLDRKRPSHPHASWDVETLALPPGAVARRGLEAAGWHWVGHDRGLARAASLAGPWRRAGSPAGGQPVLALARAGDRLFVASASGLLVGRPGRAAPEPRLGAVGAVTEDPPIAAVHAAAVRYLDLQPSRWRARFAGLRRRGLWPTLSLDFGVTDDSNRTWDDDQAFISGETRFLQDRDHRRGREYAGRVELSWDLPSLAYDDAWDDLSREVRQLVSLRDDVLDEVTQLYFERRRVLIDRAARPPDDPERARLALRAAELAAGIDAWTGGWFLGRASGASSLPSRPAKEQP